MAEEISKGSGRYGKRDREISHPLVNKVLSKISEIEEKEEKEIPRAKTPSGGGPEIPKRVKSRLGKKISFILRTFSILVVLSFGGWYLVTKSVSLKNWLINRSSILSGKIVGEKDTIWVRRKILGLPKEKVRSLLARKIRRDVKGIPVYLGASRIRVSSEDNLSTLNFATSEPMERVVAFYIREMEKRGYALVKADYWPGGSIGQLVFSTEGKECTVNLVENETGGVSVAISYTE